MVARVVGEGDGVGLARNVGEEGDWVVARNFGEEGDLEVARTVGKEGDRVVTTIVGKSPTLKEIKSRASNRPSLLNEMSHRFEFIIRRLELLR